MKQFSLSLISNCFSVSKYFVSIKELTMINVRKRKLKCNQKTITNGFKISFTKFSGFSRFVAESIELLLIAASFNYLPLIDLLARSLHGAEKCFIVDFRDHTQINLQHIFLNLFNLIYWHAWLSQNQKQSNVRGCKNFQWSLKRVPLFRSLRFCFHIILQWFAWVITARKSLKLRKCSSFTSSVRINVDSKTLTKATTLQRSSFWVIKSSRKFVVRMLQRVSVGEQCNSFECSTKRI